MGDPTRYRIFTYLREATEPVLIADLVDLLGFNHNAIRQHLAKLLAAELIVETTENRTKRGRPRRLYQARQDALDAFAGEIGSYEWLSARLLEILETGMTPYDVGRKCGVDEVDGSPRQSTEQADPLGALIVSLQRGGFAPGEATDGAEIELSRCPFADAAADAPHVVCELHRGLVDGYLERVAGSSTLTIADPHKGGCVVAVTLPGARSEHP